MRLFHDRSRLAAALTASKLSTSVQNKVMEQARPAPPWRLCVARVAIAMRRRGSVD